MVKHLSEDMFVCGHSSVTFGCAIYSNNSSLTEHNDFIEWNSQQVGAIVNSGDKIMEVCHTVLSKEDPQHQQEDEIHNTPTIPTVTTDTIESGSQRDEVCGHSSVSDNSLPSTDQKNTRNPYVDIFVAVITVPTLILLALLLDANIQDSFDASAETRSSFIVLLFGFGFLVLSLLVCGCIVHKMGMCRWNRRRYDDEVISARNSYSESVDCVHVIDLPASYDSITKCENIPRLPSFTTPPTYEMACNAEKVVQNDSNATVNHI